MNTEKLLTTAQLQTELAKILPARPGSRTLYSWMACPQPMPFIRRPATGQGTGTRTGRMYRLSDVLEWLEDPAGYWDRKRKAG